MTPSPLLLDFIQESLKEGTDRAQIAESLKTNGWLPEEIEAGLAAIPEAPAALKTPVIATRSSLRKPRVRKPIHVPAYVWLLVPVVLILLVLITPNILGLIYTDRPAADTTDLTPVPVVINDAENAYNDFEQIRTHLDQLQAATSTPARTVATNAIRNALSSITTKSAYQAPLQTDMESEAARLQTYADFFRSITGSAADPLQTKKASQGFATSLIALDAGTKLSRAHTSVTEQTLGMQIRIQALDAMRAIASHASSSTPGDFVAISSELTPYVISSQDLSGTVRQTFAANAPRLRSLEAIKPTLATLRIFWHPFFGVVNLTNYFYHPEETLSLYAAHTRSVTEILNGSCADVREATLRRDALAASLEARASHPLVAILPNALGLQFLRTHAAQDMSAKYTQCDTDLLLAVVATELLLKAYEKQTGALPETLEALATAYSVDLPLDPYSGLPLHYDAVRRVIYSVGRAEVDSGGTPSNEWTLAENPMFSI